jgi:hypothetical protein
MRDRETPNADNAPVVIYEPVLLDNDSESIQHQGGAFPTKEMAQQVLDIWRREGRTDKMAINAIAYYRTVEEWHQRR